MKTRLSFVPSFFSLLFLLACSANEGSEGGDEGSGAAGNATGGTGTGASGGTSDTGGTGTGASASGGISSGGSGTGAASTGGASTGGADTGGASTGGAGTGGASTGGSPGAGGQLPAEAIIFAEDFEGASDDTVPAGWDSFVNWVVNMSNMPGADTFALADSSNPRGGTKSLHVKGVSNPAMLTRPLPVGTNAIYVRAYVWLTNKLGQNPGNNHETLIGVRGTPGGASDEVRFGEIKGIVGTNEVPSDDISPTQDQWGLGPVIPAGEWRCIEVAFLGDTANHEVRGWDNGTEVHVVNDPSQWNNGVLGANFLDGKFAEFIIGWHSFSSYENEIWFDDIVVATQPVGCE